MTFQSILFQKTTDRRPEEQAGAPDFFGDFNLDLIVAAVTKGKEEYDLVPFFHMPLPDVDAVKFRHEVMQDLDAPNLFDDIKVFAASMRIVRENLGQLEKRFYEHQKERWFLDAVLVYGASVRRLVRDLSETEISSRGLLSFRDYLMEYAASDRFNSLMEEARRLEAELSAIRYNISIQGPRVEVHRHEGEADYSAEVAVTFERFQQGAVQGHKFEFSNAVEMNHVEAQILDGVAFLYRDTFTGLANYRAANGGFLEPVVAAFDREIQFYIAYLEYIAQFKKVGLSFCYPEVSQLRKEEFNRQGFDLALADKLAAKKTAPVTNDFYLKGHERIIVVSGPNQGGKTTFARTFGQLHYLAGLGCPVPGTEARFYLADRLFAHFEREERMTNLRGKLQDDLIRIHEILEAATPRSIIVINEIFASTTLRDAVFLSEKIAAAIIDLDVLCVWVTFIDEVSTLSKTTVSMVSTVVPDNPAQRTFKVLRRRADGLAYAMSIAEKYRLTYNLIEERIKS